MKAISISPQLILFDCDGTLTDSHGLIVEAMQAAFLGAGLAEPAAGDVDRVIGLSLRGAVCGLLDEDVLQNACLIERIMQGYREYYLKLEEQVRLFPDVRETLQALRDRGYWLGVVTGKSRAGLQRVLDSFDLDQMFLVLRTADCTHSKPDPAMVLECMDELGVTAAQTTVVGDALLDMQMAAAAGVKAIGVSFGVADGEALREAGAAMIVHQFRELLVHFPRLQAHA